MSSYSVPGPGAAVVRGCRMASPPPAHRASLEPEDLCHRLARELVTDGTAYFQCPQLDRPSQNPARETLLHALCPTRSLSRVLRESDVLFYRDQSRQYYQPAVRLVPGGYTYTWTETINFVTFNIIRHEFLTRGLGSLIRNVPRFLLPKVVRKHQPAHADFTIYMTAMIANSRANGANGRNLLDMMVASTESEKVKGGRHAGLSDAELIGNIFMFVIAGHETTAGTLSFGFVVMAAEKHVQDWVWEGLDSALESVGNDSTE